MTKKRKLARGSSARGLTWDRFAKQLASALYHLEPGEFFVLMVAGTEYFVQVADHGPYGMRVEAVSNAYLNPFFQLSDSMIDQLISLGWQPPTYVQSELLFEPSEGSPNFFVDLTCPVRTDRVTQLLIRTMGEIYGVITPSDLMYRAYSSEYESIRFSELGIKSLTGSEFECAAIIDRIQPGDTSSVQLPVMMPVEVS